MVLLLSSSFCLAEQGDGLKVEEIVFCKNIEEISPVGVSSQFFNSTDKLYCFTKIIGATDTTSVFHVWYYDGREMARVELPVRSALWRTWSSKRMMDTWDGRWKVEVITREGTVVSEKEFIYKPVGE
jgi:hypothetical protein